MSGGACRRCGTPLEEPGDFCLTCRTANADGVVVDASPDRATVTVLDGDRVVAEPVVTATPETGEREPAYLRNFAGRITDRVRRKRPEAVYMAGDRDVLAALRRDLRHECYRVDPEDPVGAALSRRGERDLEVVEGPPAGKIGGSHSTLIGGREGRRAVLAVAGHPHVKKVVPGPIDAGGTSRSGTRAKVTRGDDAGNLRLLIRNGATVQEARVITTAMDRELGERVGEDLDERLGEAGVAG